MPNCQVAFLNTLVSMYIAGVAGVSLYVNLGHFADLWRLASWASGDIPLIAVSTVLVAAWWLTDLPVLANTLAISLSLLMLKTTQLSSTKAGLILMVLVAVRNLHGRPCSLQCACSQCGLFFYDIFWVFGSERVFGSNVMVSVAKWVWVALWLCVPGACWLTGGCGLQRGAGSHQVTDSQARRRRQFGLWNIGTGGHCCARCVKPGRGVGVCADVLPCRLLHQAHAPI